LRLKLDENLGRRVVSLFEEAGHDVVTVVDEDLMGATDADVFQAAVVEQRALVSLDVDFANPLRFEPAVAPGIAVLRLPDQPEHADLVAAARRLADALDAADIRGKLWVVDGARVREYRANDA
jgi:predicted nuclease of predicted toxin-antitoxin system